MVASLFPKPTTNKNTVTVAAITTSPKVTTNMNNVASKNTSYSTKNSTPIIIKSTKQSSNLEQKTRTKSSKKL